MIVNMKRCQIPKNPDDLICLASLAADGMGKLGNGTNDQFEQAALITALVPATGVPSAYRFVDTGALDGQQYWYWLAFVQVTQAVEYYGPRIFPMAAPVSSEIYLPIVAR